MTGNSKATLVAVAAGGYLLGRTKKGKLALTVAVFLAGRRLLTDPKQLLTEGLRKLSQSPQFSQLSEQVRDDVLGAGAAALRGVVDRRVEALCDRIHERTAALQHSTSANDSDQE